MDTRSRALFLVVRSKVSSSTTGSAPAFFFFFDILVYCPVGRSPLVGHLHGAGVYRKVKALGKKRVVLCSYLDLGGSLGRGRGRCSVGRAGDYVLWRETWTSSDMWI